MNFLFDSKTYKNKINSITNLRFLSFEIWKFIFLLFNQLILSIFLNLIFIKFKYNFFSLICLYFISIIFDYFLMLFFIYYEFKFSIYEKLINIILNPSVYSLTFYINIFLFYPIFKISKQFFLYINNDNSDYNYNLNNEIILIVFYEIIFIYYLLNSQNNFINYNRKDYYKYSIKKLFIEFPYFKIFLFNFIYLFLYHKTIFVFFYFINYTFYIMFLFMYIYISYENLKNFITPVIKYNSMEITNLQKFLNYNINFEKENNFFNLHYLQLLYYIIDEKEKILNEDINLIKFKIDKIYNNLLKKIPLYRGNNIIIKNQIYYYFDFSKEKIFEDGTSLNIIEISIEITYILIMNILNSKENNNYILNHFFEILIYYEEILSDFAKKNYKYDFNKLINNLYIKTKYKIDYLIKLNMKKRIFPENKKIRARENKFILIYKNI